MYSVRLTRGCRRGQSATPVLVFLGIVVLSVVFFFALTLPRQLERRRAAAEMARMQTEMAREAAQAASGDDGSKGESSAAERADDAEKTSAWEADGGSPGDPARGLGRFASPRHFMERLVDSLASGDLAAAEAMIGPEPLAGDKAAFFRVIFDQAGMRPLASGALREIGDVAEFYRWGVQLSSGEPHAGVVGDGSPDAPVKPEPPISSGSGALGASVERVEVEVDVGRDSDRGWKCAAVHFPEPLRQAVAARLGPSSVPASVAESVEDQRDPLKIAGHFLRAVLNQDYTMARSVTDTEAVTREKVAGLCILFEEGEYSVADERPLSATAAGADAAWVIVKVKSGRDGQESDFGLELRRLPSGGGWRVAGVNFSKLLAEYAASAGASEGVAYTPIVKSPDGGESLVVYFDFNDATLVPRARRQLEIVANLLRDDPRRKLRLSGHADAIGSDSYNRQLSAARALIVRDALAALGVSPQQVVTEGLGTLRPLDPNTKPDGSDNPEGRSRNRRTEIYLDF